MQFSRFALSLVCAAMLCACQPQSGTKGDRADMGGSGEKAAPQVQFPASFPAYIPKYPGARPVNNASTGFQNKMFGKSGRAEADFITVDSREKVIEFYRTELVKAGLVERMTKSLPIMEMSVYSKDETPHEVVTVAINKMLPGDTFVQIMYSNEQGQPKN
jgi:hypothetical protein